ncbi:MAG: sugar phosphate isomerase/epimerase [Ruminococcaceae bacterium]|nr:sugar phosphate isomerase/epimerase [Oscillospiraceae bacterium]
MLNFGITTRSFNGLSAEACAARMREIGLKCTELCFVFSDLNCWAYNGVADISVLTSETVRSAVETIRAAGVEIVSLGVFSNLLEPDAEKLEQVFAYYRRFIELAAENHIPYIATENGFVPGQRGICADTFESKFIYFRDNMVRLADMAAEYGVSVAFEPCVLDLTPSAKRTRDFLLQCGRENLKILLDPANMIANCDEEDMFKYLAPYVAYFHGKDRHVNDTYGCNLGDGEIDWAKFLSLYHRHTDGRPFILEYVKNEDCEEIRDRTFAFDRAAGC